MPSERQNSYSQLYQEAEANAEPSDTLREITPLYYALKTVKERYTHWKLIGTGGTKEVFQVKDEQIEREVALARPKPEIPPERYDAFLREAHITARLDHQNIIKLFGMGIGDDERPFFTMEFKRGLSLRKILTRLREGVETEAYPLERRLQIFLKVCEAVANAHSQHVLHLDLKPENIQIGPFGEVQVCDWGMGEIESGDSEEHLSEALLDPDLYGGQLEPAFKGTPGYTPPEQENPRAPKTPRNDIFALGCILYELTTLKPLRSRLKSPPQNPALGAIIQKACEADPEDRYQTAQSLQKDVELHLTGHSPDVENAGFFREARLFYRRNAVPCLTSLLSALVLVGAGLWFTQQLRSSYRAQAKALTLAEQSLATAETEQKLADIARTEAENALERLKQERQLASNLLDLQGKNPTETTLLLTDILVLKETMTIAALQSAMDEIDQSLLLNPSPDNNLRTMKAYVLFLMQRFGEAEQYYTVREGTQGDLRQLASEFAPLVAEDGLLPLDHLIELLRRLTKNLEDPKSKPDRSPLMEKIVIYDTIRRKSPIETSQVIEYMVRAANPQWTAGTWDFDPQELSLHLDGKNIRTLYRPRVPVKTSAYPSFCLLRLLNLKKLTLRSPSLRSYEQLNELSLVELDIRTCPSHSLAPLTKIPSLKKLIISPGQFSEEQLRELAPEVVVLESAGDEVP